MDGLEEIKNDLRDINKRVQRAETSIEVSEAKRNERNAAILDRFERVESRLSELENRLIIDISRLHTKLDALQELANTGRVSLKTLWFLGAIAASVLALLSSWLQVFK